MPKKKGKSQDRRLLDHKEINSLLLKIRQMKPKVDANPFSKNRSAADPPTLENSKFKDQKLFSDLPMSKKLKRGLKKSSFTEMTDIQRESLPYSLSGYDLLGAAKTGSGKTLSFLIPIIENLYRAKWNTEMGLGALILVPTRELAQQVFDVLRTIGRYHKFSAGLVLGGRKNYEEEAQLIAHMNILVATPGRLLQHLDQSYGFDCQSLQMLVLDEADRLLEMGFEAEVTAILEHLNHSRQTLLFSATQTTQIKQLARLSLRPKQTQLVSTVQEQSMPEKLQQLYTEVGLDDKVDLLFSFLKKHTMHKTLVFISTNAQVSFLHDVFKKLPISLQVFKLKGNMSQSSRNDQFEDFVHASSGVMFATDVAARGLDFPSIHFVFQMDIPSTIETYIHRSGRTARLKASGFSILLITPEEMELIEKLKAKGIPIQPKQMNPDTLVSITEQLSSLVASDVHLKYLAMRFFEMFVKYTMKGVQCIDIDVSSYPLKAFSQRLGLFEMPKVKFAKKDSTGLLQKLKSMNQEGAVIESSGEESEDESENDSDDNSMATDEDEDFINDVLYSKSKKARIESENRMDRLSKKKHALQFSDKFKELAGVDDTSEGDDDDFFVVKRTNHELEGFIEKKKQQKAYEPENKRKHTVAKDGKNISLFESIVSEKNDVHASDIESFQKRLKEEVEADDAEDKKAHHQRQRSVGNKRDENLYKEFEAEKRKEQQILQSEGQNTDLPLRSDVRMDEEDTEYSSDVSMDEESYRNLMAISKERLSNSRRREFESLMSRMDAGEDVEYPQSEQAQGKNKPEQKRDKKRPRMEDPPYSKKKRKTDPSNVEEQEELALQLLQSSGL